MTLFSLRTPAQEGVDAMLRTIHGPRYGICPLEEVTEREDIEWMKKKKKTTKPTVT